MCKPGAHLPPSTSLPNVLIIGDSVSIGYTPPVAAHLVAQAFVQHSPWDTGDGGAEETAYGVLCLDYFLRDPNGTRLRPDVIMFNWVSAATAPDLASTNRWSELVETTDRVVRLPVLHHSRG